MSRNKDIDFIHEFTGWSYKECRRRYHENSNNLLKTLPINSEKLSRLLNGLGEATNSVIDTMRRIAKSITTVIQSIDWMKITEELRQINSEAEENKNGNS